MRRVGEQLHGPGRVVAIDHDDVGSRAHHRLCDWLRQLRIAHVAISVAGEDVGDDLLRIRGMSSEQDSRRSQRHMNLSVDCRAEHAARKWIDRSHLRTRAGSGTRAPPSTRGLVRPGQDGLHPQTRHRLRATVDSELVEDVVNVVLDCRNLNAEPIGDLLVGEPFVDQKRDLPLPRRERRHRRQRLAVARQIGDAAKQGGGERGRAERLVSRRALDGGDKLLDRRLEGHEAGDAGLGARHQLALAVRHGNRDDWVSGIASRRSRAERMLGDVAMSSSTMHGEPASFSMAVAACATWAAVPTTSMPRRRRRDLGQPFPVEAYGRYDEDANHFERTSTAPTDGLGGRSDGSHVQTPPRTPPTPE